MKKIVIIGAGGFGAEAIWALEEMNKLSPLSDHWNILGYVDDNKSKKGKVFYNYPTLGTPGEVDKIYSGNHCLLYTSPSPRDGLLSRMPSSA